MDYPIDKKGNKEPKKRWRVACIKKMRTFENDRFKRSFKPVVLVIEKDLSIGENV